MRSSLMFMIIHGLVVTDIKYLYRYIPLFLQFTEINFVYQIKI